MRKSAKRNPKTESKVIVGDKKIVIPSDIVDANPEKIQVTADTLNYSDKNTKSQDEVVESKDEVVESKDEVVESKDEVVESKDEVEGIKEENLTTKTSSDIVGENEAGDESPTFYEKVTGKKPLVREDGEEKIAFGENSSDEDLPPIEKSNKKLFLLGMVVFLLTVLVTGFVGFFVISTNSKVDESQKPEANQTEQPPTPTPEEKKVDRSNWTFEVLNGSGKTGEAKKAADLLEELGYEISSVGNANENVDSTQIYVSEDEKDEDIELVLKDLEEDFGKLSVEDNFEDEKANIRMIIGAE